MHEPKYIKVVGNDEIITVIDSYAYIYESGKGKTVLRMKISESVKSFQDIVALFNKEGNVIEEYVKDVNSEDKNALILNNTYTNYCKDFKCDYSAAEGAYSIEITRKTDTESLVDSNLSDTLDAYEAIVSLYEM